MEEIRKKLGIAETSRMYEFEIKYKWWYFIRTNVAYFLFVFLVGVYLFLLFSNLGLEITISSIA